MKISFSDLVFQLFLRGVGVSTLLHETMHVLGAALIGLYAEYRSTNLFAVYRDTRQLRRLEHLVFFGSGGWFTAALFYLFSLRNKDPENRLIARYVALSNFIYGCFEVFSPKMFWEMGSMVGMSVGLAFIFVVVLWKKPEIIL